jgi:hypothetical protein
MPDLNPKGLFQFIQADTSLIKNADRVYKDIRKKESYVNLLFLTTGSMIVGSRESIPVFYLLAC